MYQDATCPNLRDLPSQTASKFSLPRGLAVFLFLLFQTGAFSAELPRTEDPEALWERVRSGMAAHLAQLRNYTCHVVVNRLVKPLSTSQFYRDRVELEVAFVGNHELFAAAGEAEFKEQPISSIVPLGMIGNDAFGSHDDAVFSGNGATFRYVGPCKKDGHRTVRFDFHVDQEKSQLLIKGMSGEGIVAYKGSVWVDSETLDVVRLEWKTEHIPRSIGIHSVEKTMRYTLVRIGNSDFLLPRNSELAAFDQSGVYHLNMVGLERCREFTGESVVTYGAPADDPGQPKTSQ
jgi:hypothetical protein